MSFSNSRNSWLMHASPYRTVDTDYWGLAVLPEIPPADDDDLYQLQLHDRIDLLAARIYGDPRFEWVIKRANSIYLWPFGGEPGTTIRIPTIARLQTLGIVNIGMAK